MIGTHLREGYRAHGHQVALVRGDERHTYREIWDRVDAMVKSWSDLSDKRVAVCVSYPMAFIAAIIALDLLRSHVFLIAPRCPEELLRLKQLLACDDVLHDQDTVGLSDGNDSVQRDFLGGSGLVTILTSGTTGIPKLVKHSWNTLCAPVRRNKELFGTTWLLTYPLNLYAGTQVLLHSLLNWGSL